MPGPEVRLSVAGARAHEGSGASLMFPVTLTPCTARLQHPCRRFSTTGDSHGDGGCRLRKRRRAY